MAGDQLYVYEQTKQAMDFDPAAAPPEIPGFEAWNLDEHYPPRLGELVGQLTQSLALNPDQVFALQWLARCGNEPEFIEQIAEVMSAVNGPERSKDSGQVSQNPEAAEHAQPSPGSRFAADDTQRVSKVGKGRANRNGKGGDRATEPVSGR